MTTPAPRLYIPGAHQMSLKMNQGGQEAVIVLGCTSPTGAAGMDATKAAAWRDAAWTAFRPLIVPGVAITGAVVRDVSSAEGTVIEVPAPATNTTGSNASSAALASGCTLLKWSSATGGRTGKGRTYLPGLPVGAMAADTRTYTSTHVTAAGTAVTAYLSSAHWSVDWKPAILSFRRGLARPITAGALAGVIGTQRRRMR